MTVDSDGDGIMAPMSVAKLLDTFPIGKDCANFSISDSRSFHPGTMDDGCDDCPRIFTEFEAVPVWKLAPPPSSKSLMRNRFLETC